VSWQLWSAYDQMGPAYQLLAANSAYNAHYDRPAPIPGQATAAEGRDRHGAAAERR
jgi:hypothetical protein